MNNLLISHHKGDSLEYAINRHLFENDYDYSVLEDVSQVRWGLVKEGMDYTPLEIPERDGVDEYTRVYDYLYSVIKRK
jgi:hypothetical protein